MDRGWNCRHFYAVAIKALLDFNLFLFDAGKSQYSGSYIHLMEKCQLSPISEVVQIFHNTSMD